MEKLKNDEKAKHANRPDYYSQGCAFSVIVLMFLLLTIMTSYEMFKILPLPAFFYYGSMALGMLLFAFLLTLASAWHDIPIRLGWFYGTAVVLICASPLIWKAAFPIGVLGSWFTGMVYMAIFRYIPAIVFPLLLIATFCIGMLCQRKSVTLPRMEMKLVTYLVALFACIFIWGHAFSFQGYQYDEGLRIDGTSYHTIVYIGWFDPGLIYLYDCDMEILGCDLIYETDTFEEYRTYETQLVYDEAASILRLEYHLTERNAQYYDIPPILYEHPIQQE